MTKKVLSIVLSLLMVISSFATAPLGAFADTMNRIEVPINEKIHIETNDEYSYGFFVAQENGTYQIESFDYSNDPSITIYDGNNNYLTEDDDGGISLNFKTKFEATEGSTYYFTFGRFNDSYDVLLSKLDDSQIAISISYTPVNPIECIENAQGQWDEDGSGNEYFYYNTPNFNEGDILIVNYKDGSSVEYTYKYNEESGRYVFLSENGEFISTNDISRNSNQWSNHWVIGGEYNYYTIVYQGVETTVPVTIKENPVASISYTPVKPIEYIENTNGEWDEDGSGNEYFDYYTPSYNKGDVLTVNNKDGSSVEYVYAGYCEEYDHSGYLSASGEFISTENVNKDHNQWSNHWVIGGEYNYYTITYQGCEAKVPVTIKENPVASISYTPVKPIEYIENTNGHWDEDGSGNEYYYYDTPSYNIGDVLTVNNKDGSSVDYVYAGYCEEYDHSGYLSASGEFISTENVNKDHNQWSNHWVIGGEYNYYTITYQGSEAKVPVTIKENPVASISYTPVKPIEYIENTNGYWDEDGSGNEYFYYHIFNSNQGDVLTVNNKDGSSVDYVYAGYCEEYHDYGYLSASGEFISKENVYSRDNEWSNHWVIGGEYNYFTITYLDREAKVPVTIKESPVKFVEIIKVFPVYENANGYWDNDDDENTDESKDCFNYSVPPFTFRVHYKDGTVSKELNGLKDEDVRASVKGDILYVSYYGVEASVDLTKIKTCGFDYYLQNGNAIITEYLGMDKKVVIPTEVDGYKVIAVEQISTDSYNGVIEELVIPDGVAIISSKWNFGLKKLKKLELGDSVNSLNFDNLKSLFNLSNITVSENNPYYKSIDGVLYSKDGKTLVFYPIGKGTSYVVESSATNFDIIYNEYYAGVEFDINNAEYTTVDNVIYTKDMTKVIRCDSSLSGSYVMPETVTELSENAFNGCDKITSVTVSSKVTDIVYAAFADCSSLESVTLPASIKSIGDYAFDGCKSLKNINLNEGITSMGECSFVGCSSITNFAVPNSVSEIGSCMLLDCSSLESLTFGSGVSVVPYIVGDSCPKLASITIPDSVEIVNESFEGTAYCKNPDNWDNGLLYIGNHLIQADGSKIKSDIEIKEGTIEIIDYAFYDISKIETVKLPNSLRRIGFGAFRYCENLTSINIPSGVKIIESGAFRNCTSLKNLILENGIEVIEDGVFYGCSKLKDVTLPTSLISVGSYAFSGCGLEKIKIPDSVTEIVYKGFIDNNSLKEIEMPDKLVSLHGSTFDNTQWYDSQEDGIVNIGKMLYSYKGTAPETLDIQQGTLGIGAYAFKNQTVLKNVNLPDGLQEIGIAAFLGCDIDRITIPESVTTIRPFAIGYYGLDYQYILGDSSDEGNVNLMKHTRYNKNKNLVICGYAGSAAEKYAIDNEFIFEDITPHVHDLEILVEVPATCDTSGLTEGYRCKSCDYVVPQEVIPALGHDYKAVVTVPNCTEKGYTTYTCSRCNNSYIADYVNALGHTQVIDKAVAPTCAKQGKTEGSHCSVCNEVIVEQKTVPATGKHNYKTTTTKATLSKNGSVLTKCSVCGSTKSNTTIYYPKSISFSATAYTYDGKVKTPSVKVVGSNGKAISSSNYTVSYPSGRKNVGKYAVKITFKGNYSGSKTLYFTINPKGTSISKITAAKKGFKVYWKKQSTQTTGYQIQYSTSSKFSNAKTVTLTKNSYTSKSISKLSAKKKYYVRVRTYKKVGSTYYYSSWSKAKYVTTKK